MTRRQFGSIRKLPSGRWQVRHTDAFGRTVAAPQTFATKTDAALYLSKVETDQHRGTWTDPLHGRETFEAWVKRWRASTVDLRVSTLARDESYLRSLILPTFGPMPIGSIDHLAARAWVAELSASGRAPATVVKAAQIASKALRAAVSAKLIALNPFDDVPLPKVERKEMRFLTPAQVATLADAMDPRYRALVLVGAWCGLRAGEMFALRPANVDPLRRRLDVVETLVNVGGHLSFGPPKTRASRRSVPMPRVVAQALEEHVSDYPGELVFTAPEGGPIRAPEFRRRVWLRACAEVGLSGLRLHDLRHTAVALWIAANASPKEIAARAGHTSVVTVLDRYGHLLPGTEDRVNDALDVLAGAFVASPAASVSPLRSLATGT